MRTTMGALANWKIAFSPIRRSWALSPLNPARSHAFLSTGCAIEEENSASAWGTQLRIAGRSGLGQGLSGHAAWFRAHVRCHLPGEAQVSAEMVSDMQRAMRIKTGRRICPWLLVLYLAW